MNSIQEIFTKITKMQSMEFGLVTILVAIVLALLFKEHSFIVAALILTLITIIVPICFYPLAVVWFGLSKVLGMISSNLIMSFVFFLIVVTVGILRKLLGIDTLQIHQFKKDKKSVMINRDHLYVKSDLLYTF
jgi:ABC-type nitrate/sulfonate/bicarbonate transport system permease component